MKSIRKLKNIIREAIKGVWKHRAMGLASIISTFATLFVIGIILIITVTINHISTEVQEKVDEVEIFIKKNPTQLEIDTIKGKIEAIDIEKSLKYRSSQEALQIMKASWGDDAGLLDGIDSENLLPPSFVVKLTDISQADQFSKLAKSIEGVEDVKYYQDLVQQVYKASKYVRIFGAILILVLMVVSLFIISNTIKLTVFSRASEISVMKYVGATNNYIRVPFILEGMFFGIIGSGLAFVGVYYLYDFVFNHLGTRLLENFSMFSLLEPIMFRNGLLQIFLSMGIGIGVLGSIFSIRKYLKH